MGESDATLGGVDRMRRDHGVLTLSTNKGTGSKFVAQRTYSPWMVLGVTMLMLKHSRPPLGLGGG